VLILDESWTSAVGHGSDAPPLKAIEVLSVLGLLEFGPLDGGITVPASLSIQAH